MGTNEVRSSDATSDPSVARVDLKLKVVIFSVSDVDRAKEFYGRLGWRLGAYVAGYAEYMVSEQARKELPL